MNVYSQAGVLSLISIFILIFLMKLKHITREFYMHEFTDILIEITLILMLTVMVVCLMYSLLLGIVCLLK